MEGYQRDEAAIHDARGVAMNRLMKQLFHDESGQDLIEYALVATVIALGAVAAMSSLAGAIGNGLNTVGNNFNSNL